jgi:hypothetical protein
VQKAQRLVRLQAPVAQQIHVSTPAVVKEKAEVDQAAWHMRTREQHTDLAELSIGACEQHVVILAVLSMPTNMLKWNYPSFLLRHANRNVATDGKIPTHLCICVLSGNRVQNSAQ